MVALLTSLFMLGLALYIKYRFHIQFMLLIRRGYKYIQSKSNNTTTKE